MEKLDADMLHAQSLEDELTCAHYYHDVVLADMDAVRSLADAIEADLPEGALPYPSYEQLLFSV